MSQEDEHKLPGALYTTSSSNVIQEPDQTLKKEDSTTITDFRYNDVERNSTGTDSLSEYLGRELHREQDQTIKYRSCSWQKTAFLLFSEYVCLAIMSFPWSYSVLGLVPGLILTVGVAGTAFYTGLIIHQYCLKNPDVLDICDIGQRLFWGSKWAWYFTAVCFLLNNTFIQGLHVLVGAKYLNTISDHGLCTVVFSVIVAIVCFLFSLPRTLAGLSPLALFSAGATFVSVILATIFAGVQSHPGNYIVGQPVEWSCWPVPGTTYVAGMTAVLNIVYTFVGQITYPSFIAEMKDPRDFKKALVAVTVAEVVLYSLVGSIIYVYVGTNYMTAPAFGSLQPVFKKVAFSFMIPTIIFLGVLYATVSARFVFFRIFPSHSLHRKEHTLVGWLVWAALLAITWVVAFIIAEVIPFFSDLLSLMSSLFDCWFGFVFWGVAYFRLKDDGEGWFRSQKTLGDKINAAICWALIVIGFYILGPGVYATVQSIIDEYKAGQVGGLFSCASNGL